MKINSNLTKDFFEVYDESKGIAIHRKKVLKKKRVPLFSCYEEVFISLVILVIASALLLTVENELSYQCAAFLAIVSLIYLIVIVIQIIVAFGYHKNQKFKSAVTIDEEGIATDSYFGIYMRLDWSKIKAVVIKNRSITILTDTPCYFMFSGRQRSKIEEALQKYHPNTLILEKNKKVKK